MNVDEKYLTAPEVAAILRCSETHINRLCRGGKLKAIKPFGKWLVDKTALYQMFGIGVEVKVDADNEGLEI